MKSKVIPEIYESRMRQIKKVTEFDIFLELKKAKILERNELIFCNYLGYSNSAKCIEKEFDSDYNKFKEKMNNFFDI